MALRDIGVDFEHYKVVEFDKYPIASYDAIHKTDFPTIDVTTLKGSDLQIIDKEHYEYILTYSFPCTDLSTAGKMLGMAEGSGTRSSLLWEVKRLLEETENLPQVLVMENVVQVHNKKNIEHFEKWIKWLESIGYSNYWKDLNAKDYGVAQSRDRCFMVSILGDYTYSFPEPFPLNKTMKDYLDDEVEKKFYLTSDKSRQLIEKLVDNGTIMDIYTSKAKITKSDKSMESVILTNLGSSDERRIGGMNQSDVACTLLLRDYKGLSNYASNGVIEMKEVRLGNVYNEKFTGGNYGGHVWSQEGLSPTLDTCTGGGHMPMIPEIKICDEELDNSRDWVWEINGVAYQIRIRRLTPKECWRLMGFSDEDFSKAEEVNSNTQLYKQAGNSIVENVLCEVFKKLF